MANDNFSEILSPPQRRGLADDVLIRVREAIWSGRLAPGERLHEASLAESMGVSRGPVREALGQLEREGLVIKQPNKSAVVARLSRADLEEVYSLRLALERLAMQQAVRHAEPQHLAEIQSVIDTMAAYMDRGITSGEAAELDIRFHEIIYRAANHRRLYECWATLRPQIHIFLLSRNVAHPDFREQAVDQHQAILDVISERDEPGALDLIKEHLQLACEQLLESYEPDAKDADG